MEKASCPQMNIQTTRRYIQQDHESLTNLSCADAISFQTKMLKIRRFDDKIINILNTEIPTESFYSKTQNPTLICNQLKQEFHDYYDERDAKIKECIEHAKNDLEKTKALNNAPLGQLRQKNQSLRIFQQESEIESIHRIRSLKALEERCSSYF